ncbi:MAG: protein-disulfide reductase DsbD family protein [Verrucomicrobia bacterium]|nr:protein-disulfide reductase DsbD family protein [Verrucomicrobiota bacterium]MDA1086504.1 protein-disulfide reductase DsbD family protein [Verrucomicrobiota bacterium]
MRHSILSLLLFGAGLPVADAANPVRTAHVEAALISEVAAIQPGTPFRVALRLKIDPQWHTYWVNPGDAGLPTRLNWDLPDGFTASPIQWPYPHRLPVPPLMNFGYEGDVWHLITLTPPAGLEPGDDVTLRGKASWLVCKEICIPESAELELVLPVSETPAPNVASVASGFAAADVLLPAEPGEWTFAAHIDGSGVVITALPKAAQYDPGNVQFFPYAKDFISYNAPQRWSRDDSGYRLSLQRDVSANADVEALAGVLVADRAWTAGGSHRAIELDIPLSSAAPLSAADSGPDPVAASRGGSGDREAAGILFTVVLGFVGGLILNLMPCVFPVVGIKIMSFVSQAGEERARVRLHGFVYTFGVLVSFWILSGMLIAIRAGGAELGWGFQLQSPMFVFVLTVLLLAFALNLSGVFEVGLSVTNVGQKAASKSGLAGSFMSGVFATVVSTPCAAPFLAPALGAAMAFQPAQSLLVFTSIGLGLSTPYLLLSFFPAWIDRLPRPGAWMESFKQAMAFLLYATVVYLVWVLAGQLEDRRFLHVLFALVGVGLAAWIYGRWSGFERPARTRAIARIVAALLLAWAFWVGHNARSGSGLTWEKWSPDRVAELVAEGRIVYVDFTARWCATCQANKEAVFTSRRVLDQFEKLDVVALKADWTNVDPEITRALEAFGRSAVPFNLLYKPGRDAPIELPELLTPGVVIDALSN